MRYNQFERRWNGMIYLLEDDDSIRKLVIYALQSQGYEAAGFERPSEFWHAMGRRLSELVLLDVMLPEEDGLSVLKKLRSATATAAIPVIMLTAKGSEENRIEGMKVGADAYLNKPVSKELLLLSVDNLIKHKEQLRKFYLKNIISDVNFENTKDQKFMDSVSECIQQNIADSSFDVAMLAANLCMSRSNLYNKIKVLTGVSPVEFLRKFRINTAARMLIETDMSVSQIIECVGIESASYFSKVFKQEFGETPSEYQKQRRG